MSGTAVKFAIGLQHLTLGSRVTMEEEHSMANYLAICIKSPALHNNPLYVFSLEKVSHTEEIFHS